MNRNQRRLLKKMDKDIDLKFNTALEIHKKGNLKKAESIYRQVLEVAPKHYFCMHYLGVALHHQGKLEEALDFMQVSIDKNNPAFCNNLGNLLLDMGQANQAIEMFSIAKHLVPDSALYLSNLGNAYRQVGSLSLAESTLKRSIELDNLFAEAYNNLGVVYRNLNNLSLALENFLIAKRLGLNNIAILNNIGTAWFIDRNLEQATIYYTQAYAKDENNPETIKNIATLLLLRGELLTGFDLFRTRWQCRDRSYDLQDYQPIWHGQDLTGKSIAVLAEQGLGDSLMFVRYIRNLLTLTPNVYIIIPTTLKRLFTLSFPQVTVLDDYKNEYDYSIPMLNLPFAFQTTLDTIPGTIPYLQADVSAIIYWQEKIIQYPGKKIGICWAGNPRKGLGMPDCEAADRRRSIDIQEFEPLFKLPSISWFSLQKGKENNSKINDLIDFSNDWDDFADTAAFCKNLDLVITVDTSVAHLAGGLGVPVWLMSRKDGCWRWLLNKTDSPWYPNMRIFHQQEFGDWKNVVQEIKECLEVYTQI